MRAKQEYFEWCPVKAHGRVAACPCYHYDLSIANVIVLQQLGLRTIFSFDQAYPKHFDVQLLQIGQEQSATDEINRNKV